MVEFAWHLIRWPFFLMPLPLPSAWRCFWLRRFGAKVGKNVTVHEGVKISMPWRLSVGDNVWLGSGVTVLSLAKIEIEDNICLSQNVFLCTGSHDFRSESFDLITKPITVGSGTWIAAGAFIAPGVEIGHDCFIGALCVVKASLPPFSKVSVSPSSIKYIDE